MQAVPPRQSPRVAKFGICVYIYINHEAGMTTALHKTVVTIVLCCKCAVIGDDTVGSNIKLHVGQQNV